MGTWSVRTERPRELVVRAGWALPSVLSLREPPQSMCNGVQRQQSSKGVQRGSRGPHWPTACGQNAQSTNPRFSGRLTRPLRASWRPGSCSVGDLHPTPHQRRTSCSAAAAQQLKIRERGGSFTLAVLGRVTVIRSSEEKAARALVPKTPPRRHAKPPRKTCPLSRGFVRLKNPLKCEAGFSEKLAGGKPQIQNPAQKMSCKTCCW